MPEIKLELNSIEFKAQPFILKNLKGEPWKWVKESELDLQINKRELEEIMINEEEDLEEDNDFNITFQEDNNFGIYQLYRDWTERVDRHFEDGIPVEETFQPYMTVQQLTDEEVNIVEDCRKKQRKETKKLIKSIKKFNDADYLRMEILTTKIDKTKYYEVMVIDKSNEELVMKRFSNRNFPFDDGDLNDCLEMLRKVVLARQNLGFIM